MLKKAPPPKSSALPKTNDVSPKITEEARRQFKAQLAAQGITQKQWAADNGFTYAQVVRLLNGFSTGQKSASHLIAVRAGLVKAPKAGSLA